jgi:hypothetical protein
MRISYGLKWVLRCFLLIFLCVYVSFILSSPELKSMNSFLKLGLYAVIGIIFFWTIKIFYPSWEKGALGERWVHLELQRLPKEYLHVNDFYNSKRGNVDFVVVGPTGMFAIEVKNPQKGLLTMQHEKLCINGSLFAGKDPLAQAYAESLAIQTYLREKENLFLPVTPILVFANPKVKMTFGKHKQRGVYVIGINWLNDIIRGSIVDSRLTPDLCHNIQKSLKKYCSDIV